MSYDDKLLIATLGHLAELAEGAAPMLGAPATITALGLRLAETLAREGLDPIEEMRTIVDLAAARAAVRADWERAIREKFEQP